MREVARVVAAVVVVILGAVAAAPAVRAEDKPAKAPATRPATTKPAEQPLDGIRGVAALIPAEHWPDARRGWTTLQRQQAEEWINANLPGRRIRVAGRVADVTTEGEDIGVAIAPPEAKGGGRTAGGNVYLLFPKTAAGQLKSVRQGQQLTADGVIRTATMTFDVGITRSTPTFNLRVEDATMTRAR